MKIGRKLLISYFILLIAVFAVTAVTFKIMLQQYYISQAKATLKSEAQTMAATLEKVPIFDKQLQASVVAKKELRIAGQFIDSKVIILNKDRKVVYTNLTGTDKKELQAIASKGVLKASGYVQERVPIYAKSGEIKGYVFLFTKIEDIKRISSLMNRTQIMSLFIGGVFAVLLGMIFQRGLTSPISKLKYHMTNFSFKDSAPELMIKTGDEIEELAECFSNMIQKLKRYDLQQKKFLQNTSHELKTPLMSIQGYAEAIKDGVVEGDEMEQGLDIIIQESKRLKKTVDEMIYLIKLDNVEETFSCELICIQDIIDGALRSIKALADTKGIIIKIEGDCSYKGNFDGEKLTRAFINILGNGIRYAEKEIKICCKEHASYFEIIIADDGKGFQNGEESKIFERFYKGENGGTGIGLAITKAIVNGHSGSIHAYNAEQKGAAFKIMLPKLARGES